jgi:hypothetical protein
MLCVLTRFLALALKRLEINACAVHFFLMYTDAQQVIFSANDNNGILW